MALFYEQRKLLYSTYCIRIEYVIHTYSARMVIFGANGILYLFLFSLKVFFHSQSLLRQLNKQQNSSQKQLEQSSQSTTQHGSSRQHSQQSSQP